MAYAIDIPFTANADLDTKQYFLVVAGSVADEVKVSATDAASVTGVLQNDPNVGEEAVVRVFGRSWIKINTEASACATTYGGLIASASDGMGRGFIPGAACKWAIGYALEAISSGCGVLAEMFVFGPQKMADA